MASGGWNTIESDAGVFTYLLDNLGARGVQFEELIALDESMLQELSPVYGVIFLFKYPTGGDSNQAGNGDQPQKDKPNDGSYDYDASEQLFFAAQMIQNACGTQALLSVLLNVEDSGAATAAGGAGEEQEGKGVDIGQPLREFKDFTTGFPAEFRGEALSNSELIRTVHNSFAKSSPFVDETQQSRFATDEDDVYHFIAYTPINGVLYELDGLQPAPISHGPCTFDEFPGKVIPVLQRRIGRYPDGEIRFNLMAMVRDLRVNARLWGDLEMLEREERKRKEWRFENALRRHNFVGFAGEVLKAVIGEKLKEGKGGEEKYREWIEEAKGVTKKRMEDGRRGQHGAGGASDEADIEMAE